MKTVEHLEMDRAYLPAQVRGSSDQKGVPIDSRRSNAAQNQNEAAGKGA